MTVAKTILEQLGGAGRLAAMVGASHMTYSETALQFQFKGCKKANIVKVELNGSDLYNITFHKYNRRTYDVKEAAAFTDVYGSEMKATIEEYTGLYLSL